MMPGSGPLRLAEAAGVLSLATDLAMGQPLEHGLRTAVLGVRTAAALGLPEQDLVTVFYTGMLHFAGCTADSAMDVRFLGDEIAVRPQLTAALYGSRRGLVVTAARAAHPGSPNAARAAAMARSAVSGLAEFRRWAASHCEVAELLGARMGLTEQVQSALGHLYERWDGKGLPGDLRGEQVPLPVRVMQVAQDADIAWQRGGPVLARRKVRGRAGSGLDPQVAGVFLSLGDQVYTSLDAPSIWEEALASEPGPQPVIGEDQMDACLSAMADFADLKSMWTIGHSRGVAALGGAAAGAAGLGAAEAAQLRRAALVHDIGRVAVPARVWAKPGPLSRGEREQVRLHAYHSERVLDIASGLRPLARLAGSHGERCDGSGYHRGSRAGDLPLMARLLAAADCYQAMREPRPYRPALPPAEAADELRREAEADRLSPEAVTAVLAAAGQPQPPARWPGGLSSREQEVLGLLARGLATKQAARQLGISAKTCDHHIQRLYRKLGVSTRAGATLYAVEHGLLERGLGSFPGFRRRLATLNVSPDANQQEVVTVLKLLPTLLPWWVAGPGLGLCVAALYGLANRRLGVSGAWLAAVIAPIEGWPGERWRAEFLAAMIGGAFAAGVLGSDTQLTGYPVLWTALPAGVLIPLLAGGGLALGYGARCAEGCTSGHGLSGCAAGSPDSLAATSIFFAVAVAVTFAAHALTGGAL